MTLSAAYRHIEFRSIRFGIRHVEHRLIPFRILHAEHRFRRFGIHHALLTQTQEHNLDYRCSFSTFVLFFFTSNNEMVMQVFIMSNILN